MIVTKEMGVKLEDTTITKMDPVFFDPFIEPIEYRGMYKKFVRVPEEVAKQTNEFLYKYRNTSAGVRMVFRTDSDYIAIHTEYEDCDQWCSSYTNAAVSGFNVAVLKGNKLCCVKTVSPSQGEGKNYAEGRVMLEEGMKEVEIVFPLFIAIKKMYIALREGSKVLKTNRKYKYDKPVVFYGSSIVHGVGSSIPFNTYPNLASYMYGFDYYNYGFGAGAKTEEAIIDFLASLDMSVFVYDYDHNAPSVEYFAQTHYRGYKQFREKQPNTPIILISKFGYYYSNLVDNERRRKIILDTYQKGIEAGDKNLWFIDGRFLVPKKDAWFLTTDLVHPNDIGYYYMAKRIGKVVVKAIKERQ